MFLPFSAEASSWLSPSNEGDGGKAKKIELSENDFTFCSHAVCVGAAAAATSSFDHFRFVFAKSQHEFILTYCRLTGRHRTHYPRCTSSKNIHGIFRFASTHSTCVRQASCDVLSWCKYMLWDVPFTRRFSLFRPFTSLATFCFFFSFLFFHFYDTRGSHARINLFHVSLLDCEFPLCAHIFIFFFFVRSFGFFLLFFFGFDWIEFHFRLAHASHKTRVCAAGQRIRNKGKS